MPRFVTYFRWVGLSYYVSPYWPPSLRLSNDGRLISKHRSLLRIPLVVFRIFALPRVHAALQRRQLALRVESTSCMNACSSPILRTKAGIPLQPGAPGEAAARDNPARS